MYHRKEHPGQARNWDQHIAANADYITWKFPENKRRSFFYMFYSLDRQKQFACSSIAQRYTLIIVGVKDQRHCQRKKKTNVSRAFFFTVSGKEVRVCRKLIISGDPGLQGGLRSACHDELTARHFHRLWSSWQKHAPQQTKQHIENCSMSKNIVSFPFVESHCTKKDT